jgi:hypothetical protein
VNESVLAFLDRHLRGHDTVPLERLADRFPEVELRARRADDQRLGRPRQAAGGSDSRFRF